MGQRTYKPKHRSYQSKEFNPLRDKTQAMYQSRPWRNYCDLFLAVNSECYSCGDKATETDHLVPHQGCEKLFKQLDNHIPLCKSCHSTVTTKFDRYHRPGNSVSEKIKWLNRYRVSTDKWTPKKVKVLPSFE